MDFYPQKSRPVIWGHRGLPKVWPENSLKGFQEARIAGATGIECDLRLTRDGQVIVMHDPLIDRTTSGKGAVHELSWTYLQEVVLRNPAGSLSNQHIPQMTDVLASMDGACLINFELKGPTRDAPLLIPQLARAIHEFHAEDRVLVSSFNPGLLKVLAQQDPDIAIALLLDGLYDNVADLARQVGACAVHVNQESYDSGIVSVLHQQAIAVGVYEIWRPEDLRQIQEADAWFLDDPGWIRAI